MQVEMQAISGFFHLRSAFYTKLTVTGPISTASYEYRPNRRTRYDSAMTGAILKVALQRAQLSATETKLPRMSKLLSNVKHRVYPTPKRIQSYSGSKWRVR